MVFVALVFSVVTHQYTASEPQWYDTFAFPRSAAPGLHLGKWSEPHLCHCRPSDHGRCSFTTFVTGSQEREAFQRDRPCSTLPQTLRNGYSEYFPLSTICTESGRVANASQSVMLAGQDIPAWLRDSICQAPAQIQLCSLHLCVRRRRCCPATGDREHSNEGCHRVCPTGQDEEGFLQPLLHCIKEGWRFETNPRTVSTEYNDWFVAIDHVLILPLQQTFSLVCQRRTIIPRSSLLGCPCFLLSSRRLRRLPLLL